MSRFLRLAYPWPINRSVITSPAMGRTAKDQLRQRPLLTAERRRRVRSGAPGQSWSACLPRQRRLRCDGLSLPARSSGGPRRGFRDPFGPAAQRPDTVLDAGEVSQKGSHIRGQIIFHVGRMPPGCRRERPRSASPARVRGKKPAAFAIVPEPVAPRWPTISPVRCPTSRSRMRRSACRSTCSGVRTSAKRMVGRVTASAIAAASTVSVLLGLTEGLTKRDRMIRASCRVRISLRASHRKPGADLHADQCPGALGRRTTAASLVQTCRAGQRRLRD